MVLVKDKYLSIIVVSIILVTITLTIYSIYTIYMGIQEVNVKNIIENPGDYKGEIISLKCRYYGWFIPANLTGPPYPYPPITRSDWVLADNTAWIYATGKSPASCGLKPTNLYNIGKEITIKAVVKTKNINNKTIPYLYVIECVTK